MARDILNRALLIIGVLVVTLFVVLELVGSSPTSTLAKRPSATPSPTVAVTPSPTPPMAGAGADPLTCTGYPEPRVFLEVQSWWTEPGIPDPMHLHAGTCFPLLQTVSGTLQLDIRVMLHKNVGKLFAINADIYVAGKTNGQTRLNISPSVGCTDPSGLCEFWYTMYLNTTRSDDGWRELRLKPRMQFPPAFDQTPGATQETSTGWAFRIDNGSHSNGGNRSECASVTAECQLQFRGWYELRGYGNAAPLFSRDWIPQPVWSGTSHVSRWRFYNNAPSGEDEPLTGAKCYVDPDFHNPSWVENPFWTYAGTFPVKANIVVPLTGLVDGTHRLVCRATSNQPSNSVPGSLDGLGVVRFTVDN